MGRWLALGLLAHSVFALDPKQLTYRGHVNDFAGVLNPVHRAELEQYCRMVAEKTGVQMALVTLRSLEGEVIEDFANRLYRHWGIGKKETDEGLLLLLSVSDRRMRLEVGYGMEAVFPDGYSGSLLRSMRPALREGGYGPALLEAAHQIGSRIAQAKGVSLDVSIPSRRDPESYSGGFPSWLPVLGIVLLVLFLNRRRRHGGSGFPVFFPMGMGSGWGGTGRGGFGGSDSSDSFGGFGGGDSGGGGASSDW